MKPRWYAVNHRSEAVTDLAERQLGVVTREQLHNLRIHADHVEHEVAMQRWKPWGPRVVLLQNTPPDQQQRWWAGVLHAGEGAALASLSVLEANGVKGFETDVTHVIVRRGHKVSPLTGLKVHESRRFELAHIHPSRTPSQLTVPRAAIDSASWQRVPRRGCAILAATVQQGAAKVDAMLEELDGAGKINRHRLLRMVLHDIEGGSHSLGEIDLLALCRRRGLQPPRRQSYRVDAHGRRRYLDAEWRLPDGTVLVLEIDGAHHMTVEHWDADLKRQRAVTISGRTVLRCTAIEARLEPDGIAADLVTAGVPTTLSVRRAA